MDTQNTDLNTSKPRKIPVQLGRTPDLGLPNDPVTPPPPLLQTSSDVDVPTLGGGRLATFESTPAQIACTALGAGFVIVGLLGFVAPNLLGMHLMPVHNWVHLISGAISLWFGLKGSPKAAFNFAVIFGSFYGLLGISGFVFGFEGVPMMMSGSSMMVGPETDRFLLPLISGRFELGTSDHIVHIILGSLFLLGALRAHITQEKYVSRNVRPIRQN